MAMSDSTREKDAVQRLAIILGMDVGEYLDPKHISAIESGADVVLVTADWRRIAVQVTELDTGSIPGRARGKEVYLAGQASGRPYATWVQNDVVAIEAAIRRAIRRKVKIAAKHDFTGYEEVWLLVWASVPQIGAIGSTFMPPWTNGLNVEQASANLLSSSKYDRAFVLDTAGIGPPLYAWMRGRDWAVHSSSRVAYTDRPSAFDVLSPGSDWLRDPEGTFERELAKCCEEYGLKV